MDDSDEETTSTKNTPTKTTELNLKTRERILDNEMRSFKNRGFHDGYDEGKRGVVQQAFDVGYQKAFEQNFILSTLKGVAHALKSPSLSHNLNRPTSTTPSTSSSSSSSRNRSSIGNTSNSSSSSNVSSQTGCSSSININISSNHLSMLESMKFDNAGDIESIKSDLIKICRENRLEILAHYVSNIG